MKSVKIAGRLVNPLGIGTWNIGNSSSNHDKEIQTIKFALEHGIQVIDTAEMYGDGKAESLVGEAIQGFSRDDLYLVSKVLPSNASKKQLPKSLNASLKRLKVDYLDLYLLHWRGAIPLDETVDALEEAKKTGKIKAWGVSNFDTNDLRELLRINLGRNCAANQVKYNIIDRGIEFDLQPFMRQEKIPLMAYSPIIKGNLNMLSETQQSALKILAQKYSVGVFQILLAWTMRNDETIVIPKTGDLQHMTENLLSLNIQFEEIDLQRLDRLFPKPGHKRELALW